MLFHNFVENFDRLFFKLRLNKCLERLTWDTEFLLKLATFLTFSRLGLFRVSLRGFYFGLFGQRWFD
jgi:hypothetical protein